MYNAVTFDTQTVRTNSFDFDGGLLKLLTQLKDHPTMVVVSEVISSEILKQLSDHTQQVISTLDSAMKRARDFGVGEFQIPSDRSHARQIAQQRYKKFSDELSALTIPANGVEIKDLLRLYFQNQPPFSNKKKAEFPDAIALLSLEKWAEKNDYRVLAISGDKDWAAFGEHSKRIDVVEDVATALDILNGQATEVRKVAGQALKLVADKTDVHLYENFVAQLEDGLRGQVVDAEADDEGYLSVTGSTAEITLIGFEFVDVDKFDLLAWDANTEIFIVALDVELHIVAKADFYFSLYDPKDEENINVGNSTKTVERDWSVRIYVTILVTDGDYDIGTVGLFRAPNVVHFGAVEPDRNNDYFEQPYYWDLDDSEGAAAQVIDVKPNEAGKRNPENL